MHWYQSKKQVDNAIKEWEELLDDYKKRLLNFTKAQDTKMMRVCRRKIENTTVIINRLKEVQKDLKSKKK